VPAPLLAPTGPTVLAPEVVEVDDLATLKPTDAARLHGKRSLFRAVIDGPRDRQGENYFLEILLSRDPQSVLFLPAGRPGPWLFSCTAAAGRQLVRQGY
jgi:hypothetical protein